MSKFVRQLNNSSCGPIAILNALKWLYPDDNITYSDYYKEINELCKTTRHGTLASNFEEALEYYYINHGLRWSKLERFNYQTIKKHLKSGDSIILGHVELPQEGISEFDYEGHYSFWYLGDDNEIYGVNTLRRPAPTVNYWPLEMLKHLNKRTKEILMNEVEVYIIFGDRNGDY